MIVDEVPAGKNWIYFAFVNYPTLGYGDITPVENWQLLGPITAMNGVLLFGWSTAVISMCCAGQCGPVWPQRRLEISGFQNWVETGFVA
jgi:hypothetical protein